MCKAQKVTIVKAPFSTPSPPQKKIAIIMPLAAPKSAFSSFLDLKGALKKKKKQTNN